MSDSGLNGRIYARIAGTGSYLPEKVLTNDDLSKFVDTTDEWIAARTGIRERHVAAEGETTGDLAYHASVRALEAAGVSPQDIDLIVLGTTTPDLIFPSTACLLQHRLGANGCAAFDVNAACSGFVYALTVADKFIRSGAAKTALVVSTSPGCQANPHGLCRTRPKVGLDVDATRWAPPPPDCRSYSANTLAAAIAHISAHSREGRA